MRVPENVSAGRLLVEVAFDAGPLGGTLRAQETVALEP